MAGNFTINVVVTGAGGGGTGGGTGGTGGAGTGALATAVAGFAGSNLSGLSPRLNEQQVAVANVMMSAISERQAQSRDEMLAMTGIDLYRGKSVAMPLAGGGTRVLFDAQGAPGSYPGGGTASTKSVYNIGRPTQYRKKSFFQAPGFQAPISGKVTRRVYATDGSPLFTKVSTFPEPGEATDIELGSLGQTSGFTDLVRNHFVPNAKRYGALASAIAYKTFASAVNVLQHQSGDSYYNQQLGNAIKLTQYIGAVALGGPLGGFIAAGIVVNELADAVTGVMNFNFDRKIERTEITNNMIAAGNASYGRMRGVGV